MPTYVCTAAAGRLTPIQKTEIVRSITAIHHEETGAPRYLVQVIFHDVAPGDHYVVARPAPADQIWIRADIRAGRTDEQKSQMLRRMMQDVGRASGAAEDAVWIYLCEIPAANIAEYGRLLRPRGGGRMVLVATRCHAGKAQATGLTTSKGCNPQETDGADSKNPCS